MSDVIENGLPLSLRIYDALEKQKRFKYTCAQGILHNEYQYTDNCQMPPFQIKRASDPSTDIDVYIICVDSGTEYDMSTECPDLINDIDIITVGAYDYITYPANHVCCGLGFVTKTLVYLRIEDGVSTWYSELFYIDAGAGIGDLDTYYRVWLPGSIRSVDPDDLRIWR
jgi:hypothetical protein